MFLAMAWLGMQEDLLRLQRAASGKHLPTHRLHKWPWNKAVLEKKIIVLEDAILQCRVRML